MSERRALPLLPRGSRLQATVRSRIWQRSHVSRPTLSSTTWYSGGPRGELMGKFLPRDRSNHRRVDPDESVLTLLGSPPAKPSVRLRSPNDFPPTVSVDVAQEDSFRTAQGAEVGSFGGWMPSNWSTNLPRSVMAPGAVKRPWAKAANCGPESDSCRWIRTLPFQNVLARAPEAPAAASRGAAPPPRGSDPP